MCSAILNPPKASSSSSSSSYCFFLGGRNPSARLEEEEESGKVAGEWPERQQRHPSAAASINRQVSPRPSTGHTRMAPIHPSIHPSSSIHGWMDASAGNINNINNPTTASFNCYKKSAIVVAWNPMGQCGAVKEPPPPPTHPPPPSSLFWLCLHVCGFVRHVGI